MKHFVMNFFFFFDKKEEKKDIMHELQICRGETEPIREELRLATTISDQSD
jgi:hypothetical protein